MTNRKIAPKIEAKRESQAYHATPDELQALDEAGLSGIASDDEVDTAFRAFRPHLRG